MNEFERLRFEGADYGYFKTEKLSNNQTISIFFTATTYNRATEYTVTLAIANKKKHIKEWLLGQRDIFDNHTTGKCGLEGLIWAKKNMISFEIYIKNKKHYHATNNDLFLTVFWTDNRRRNVYERQLGKIGYSVAHRHGQKCLAKKIVSEVSRK